MELNIEMNCFLKLNLICVLLFISLGSINSFISAEILVFIFISVLLLTILSITIGLEKIFNTK